MDFFVYHFNEFKRFLKRGSVYNFSIKDWPDRWIFHGLDHIQTTPSLLVIEHSEAGCLLKKSLWKDFEIDFELKFFPENKDVLTNKGIPPSRSLGILFRADNLDSYYMVELHYESKEKSLYIKPHVRLNGYWEVLGDFKIKKKIDISDFFNVRLKVEKQDAKLFINNIQVYEWTLPTHINRYGRPDDTNDNDKHKLNSRTVPLVPFWHSYGMIGFRASWYQGAFIRNLKITSLSKFDKIIFFLKK